MERYKKGKRISIIVIWGNILLAIFKVSIGIIARSSALIADGFHSVSDIVSTLAVIIAINIANKPPDEKHPYGHGQAEPIAAKILGIILMFTGVLLAFNTGRDIINGNITISGLSGFWVALFSILVKEIMFRYTYNVGKKTSNQALIADAWHHRSDAISSVAAAIGIFGSYLGYPIMDPIAAIIVAFMIIRVGWKVVKDAIGSLMISSPPEEKIKKIKKHIRMVTGVEEIVDLKIHYNGINLYMDLKILVDYSLSVLQGHQIASEVKHKIFEEYPETKEVLIHVDPMLP